MARNMVTYSDSTSSRERDSEKSLPKLPAYSRLQVFVSRKCTRVVRYWWAWEVLAAIVSILATTALVIFLDQVNGRQQASLMLGTTSITINTIVALISTVIRTSLLITVAGALNQSPWNWFAQTRSNNSPHGRELRDMDTFGDAAMDSWSSLVLIWRTRGRALASLGATITVLSLGFDAFAQQILTSQAISVRAPESENGAATDNSLPRVTNLSSLLRPVLSGSNNNDGPDITNDELPIQARGALLSAFLNSVPYPNAKCPTGNCTWPASPTLALCSACIDISDQIQLNGSSLEDQGFLKYSILLTEIDDTERTTFPLSIVIPRGSFGNSSIGNGNLSAVMTVSTLPSENFTTGRLSVIDYYSIGIPPTNYEDFINVWLDQPLLSSKIQPLINAYKCSFYYCLQVFTAEIVEGETRQSVVSSWDQFESPDFANDFELKDVPSDLNVQNTSDYHVDSTWALGLNDALTGILIGSVSVTVLGDGGGPNASPVPFISFSEGVEEFMEILWQSSNSTQTISDLTSQVASGFTTYMRTAVPSPEQEIYQPNIFATEIVVIVRWAWLAFPLGLLIAGHIFLLATVWQTKRRKVLPWKGHRVPLLLTNLDPFIEEIAREGLGSRTGLKDRVGRVQVYLDYDEQDRIALKKVT